VRPLHAIALGLVVIALYARAGDYDLLPDPLGWVLVLLGLLVLTERIELARTRLLWVLGAFALAADVVLSIPSAVDWFEDAEPALGWAMDAPALAFCAVLCHALAIPARTASATWAASWFEWTAIGFALTVLAPVLVIGGDIEELRAPAEVVTGLAQVSLFLLCIVYASRAWAGAPAAGPPGVVDDAAEEGATD